MSLCSGARTLSDGWTHRILGGGPSLAAVSRALLSLHSKEGAIFHYTCLEMPIEINTHKIWLRCVTIMLGRRYMFGLQEMH